LKFLSSKTRSKANNMPMVCMALAGTIHTPLSGCRDSTTCLWISCWNGLQMFVSAVVEASYGPLRSGFLKSIYTELR
jgi:hypothetical protein